MNNERAGEPVFGNVDAALAERIAFRAKENSREPPGAGCVYGADVVGTGKRERRWGLIVKAAIPAALALIALWLLVRRRCWR